MNIKNRNVLVGIIISFITCGIFGFYWAFINYRDASKITGGYDIIEAIITMFVPSAGYYYLEKKFAANCEAQGLEHTSRALIYFIVGLIPVFGAVLDNAIFQAELNKIARFYEF